MVTRAQLDEVHKWLDDATFAMNDLIDAQVTENKAALDAAMARLSGGLGNCKFALRAIQPDR